MALKAVGFLTLTPPDGKKIEEKFYPSRTRLSLSWKNQVYFSVPSRYERGSKSEVNNRWEGRMLTRHLRRGFRGRVKGGVNGTKLIFLKSSFSIDTPKKFHK